jgi:hypothetical protein
MILCHPEKKLCKRDFFLPLFYSSLDNLKTTTLHHTQIKKGKMKKSSEASSTKRKREYLFCYLSYSMVVPRLTRLAERHRKNLLPKRSPCGLEIKKEPSSITRQKKKRLNASAGRFSSFFLPFSYHKHHHHPGFISKKRGSQRDRKGCLMHEPNPTFSGFHQHVIYVIHSFIPAGYGYRRLKKKNDSQNRASFEPAQCQSRANLDKKKFISEKLFL